MIGLEDRQALARDIAIAHAAGARLRPACETVGIDFRTTNIALAPTESKTLNFKLFLGPKDKSLFDKNEMYKNLGFVL